MNFEQFKSNPLMYIAFLGLGVIGYLYFDVKSTLTTQNETLQTELTKCQGDKDVLNRDMVDIAKECNGN